jgi:hypothetical protein
LRHLGKVFCPTVGQNTHGRLGREYWPNEKNARLTFSRQSRSLAPHVEKGRVGFRNLSVIRRSPRHKFVRVVFLWLGAMGGLTSCRYRMAGLRTRCCPATLFARDEWAETQTYGVQS